MKMGPTYKVDYRRKRNNLTNYAKRLKMLKSGLPRFVVRKSNNATQCQLVEYASKGDKIIVASTSLMLAKLGYKGHAANIPASYLTGYMCGLAAQKKGVKKAILDHGLYTPTKGSRIYAAVKGLADSGVVIPHNPDIVPNADKLNGKQIAAYANELKSKSQETYKKLFSNVIKQGLEPEKMVEHIEEIKKKIKA